MGILVVFLLSKTLLNTSKIKKLSRVLELHWKGLFEIIPVLFQSFGMFILKVNNLCLIFLLSPLKFEVPVLVEILILFDMRLLNLFLLLLVSKHQLLVFHVVLLLFQLSNPVLGHFSL